MHIITLQINNDGALHALKDLELKEDVHILDDFEFNPKSPALPGNELGPDEFRDWIKTAERSPSISLAEAKEEWAKQISYLLKLGNNPL